MKDSFKQKVYYLILGFVLVISINSTVQAKEIQNAQENPFLAGKSINIEGISLNHQFLKYSPTSLGIDKINIDIDSLHDTNPLSSTDKNMLSSQGYNFNQIKQMDRGDFLEIRKSGH